MVWGNGKEENIPFENAVSSILNAKGLILDVGSGRYKVHPDCLGVDAYTDNETVNVKAYMWDMPFDDNSIDAIFCFSSLEHVSKYHVLPTLTEFKRVLKPNHTMLLLVPDLEWVLWSFLANPTSDWEMDMLFGVQTHDHVTINEGEFHRTGFTKPILVKYIETVGGLEIKEFYKINAYEQYNIGILIKKI